MVLLFRLPFLLLQLLLRRLLGRAREDDRFAPAPATGPAAAPAQQTPGGGVSFTGAASAPEGPPPPTAEEAIERRFAREAADVAAPDPTPAPPLRPIGDDGHVDREVEVVESFGPADDVGVTITVDEPWDGYDRQPAAAIVARLRDADGATRGVVALYERRHKGRATILRAAG